MRQQLTRFVPPMIQDVPRSWYGKRDRAAFWFLTDLSIQGNNLTGVCLNTCSCHTPSPAFYDNESFLQQDIMNRRLHQIWLLEGKCFFEERS